MLPSPLCLDSDTVTYPPRESTHAPNARCECISGTRASLCASSLGRCSVVLAQSRYSGPAASPPSTSPRAGSKAFHLVRPRPQNMLRYISHAIRCRIYTNIPFPRSTRNRVSATATNDESAPRRGSRRAPGQGQTPRPTAYHLPSLPHEPWDREFRPQTPHAPSPTQRQTTGSPPMTDAIR